MTRLATCLLLCAVTAPAADFLEGRVWERDGDQRRPLAKALVTVQRDGRGPGPSMVRSDAEGRWRIAGPLDGRYFVSASRPGYYLEKTDTSGQSRILVDCAGPCGPLEIELIRGGAVNGVIEDDQGEPLQNMRVILEPETGESSAEDDEGRGFNRAWGGLRERPDFNGGPSFSHGDSTDDLGRFRAAGLRPGRYRIRAESFGRPDAPRYELAAPVAVDIAAGEEVEIRVGLQRGTEAGLELAGTVAGVDLGRPGSHMLHIQPASGSSGSRGSFGRRVWGLRPDGGFEVNGLTPGRYFFSYAYSADRRPPRQTPLGSLEIRGSMSGVTLSPVSTLEVKGRFELDGEGEIRGAEAMLIPLDGAPPAGVFARGPKRDFEQSGFYPGVYRLATRSRDWFLAGVEIHGEPRDPASLAITANVDDLVIRLSNQFARVEGAIHAPPPAQSSRFTVTLTSDGRSEVRPSDQNGRFIFERLVPGDYQICARPSDARADSACAIERRFPVDAGADVELVLSVPR